MRAGLLDRRVTIQRCVARRGETGEPVEEWHDVATVWMSKRDVRASERFTGAETVAEVESVFKARFAAVARDIRPDTHRLVHRGQAWAILGMTELGRGDGMEFACAARGEAAHAGQPL